jgi:fatty-acid desaturase
MRRYAPSPAASIRTSMTTTNAAVATILAPKAPETHSPTAPGRNPQAIPAPQPAERVDQHLPRWLRLPMGVSWSRVRWGVTGAIVGIHALALFAALPWLFSWSGLILAVAGVYVFGTLGINICYHRLLTHRSFKTPKWFERFLSLLALCCLEGSPVTWVANHRMHHQHSDKEPDPHSPVVAFLWSHVGWLLVENRDVDSHENVGRYARDIIKDPFYRSLSHRRRWLTVYGLHALAFILAGAAFGAILGGGVAGAVQMGLSWLVWGVFVRTVLVWHITWSVNSFTHLAGYRNYETNENSRNNWVVALLSMGEGWHNNHHADQRSAAHGHRWWEIDFTYLTILLFGRIGLAADIVPPRKTPGGGHHHHHHHHDHAGHADD